MKNYLFFDSLYQPYIAKTNKTGHIRLFKDNSDSGLLKIGVLIHDENKIKPAQANNFRYLLFSSVINLLFSQTHLKINI